LGGGGARGFFHMGVIKAIQERKIKIDKIAGTSIGAVVGAIFAANPDVDFEKLVGDLDFLTIIKSLKGIEVLLKKYVGVTNFSELKIPFCFNVTDINQKKEVVFKEGPLFPGLVAAISLPGVFPPVKISDRYFIDGGVVNNVPMSLVKSTRNLIVSDITGPVKKIDEKSSGFDVMVSSLAVMQTKIEKDEVLKIKNQKVTYLNLADNDVFILDFRKKNYKELMDLGYKAMMESGLSK